MGWLFHTILYWVYDYLSLLGLKGVITPHITCYSIVCSTSCSSQHQRKHRSSVLLAICEVESLVTHGFPSQGTSDTEVMIQTEAAYDDVIKWKLFPRHWNLNSPSKRASNVGLVMWDRISSQTIEWPVIRDHMTFMCRHRNDTEGHDIKISYIFLYSILSFFGNNYSI